jgi:hypothetical protein
MARIRGGNYTHNSATSRIPKPVTEKIQSGSSVAAYQKLIYEQFDGKGNLIRLNAMLFT